MKISRKILPIILILIFSLVAACNKSGNRNDSIPDSDISKKSADKKIDSTSGATFYYEPDTCAIYGLLNRELFYGPPGYGENTKKDAKEFCYILTLKNPVDVKPRENSDKDFDKPLSKINRIQIYSPDKKVTDFLEGRIGDNVMVRGRLFGASTGHHHTPVVLEVYEYKYYGM